MKRRLTTKDFIERSQDMHGSKYNYSQSRYTSIRKKIKILCKIHGEFYQTPQVHWKGYGCTKCTSIDTPLFVKKSKEIHGDQYDYSLVKYINNKTNVKIICKIHGEFYQTPDVHWHKHGCPKCIYENKNLNTEQFINLAQSIHGNTYDYSTTQYINGQIKVKIICKTHGEFLQFPASHWQGHGCRLCANESRLEDVVSFIKKSQSIHGDIYDYSLVQYIDNKTKLDIICKKHGVFSQSPSTHFNGKRGCPKCASDNRKLTTEEFIKRSKNTHGNTYDYSLVQYVGNNTNVEITCSIHGSFFQTPHNHWRGLGCAKCGSQSVSKQEQLWLKYLDVPDTPENRQVKINLSNQYIRVDGYISETNTIYEYWGDFWHGNPKIYPAEHINKISYLSFGELYQKTLQKRQLIIDAGYNLVEIWESDWIKQQKEFKQHDSL